MSLKTKLEYDVCVEENKCNKVDFYDQHTCYCWTSQSIFFMNNKEEIDISTIDEHEDCYDGCKITQTDAQLKNYRCQIECMKGDDYESEKVMYEIIGAVVGGIILILVGVLIWRCCFRKHQTVVLQGQQPNGIIVQQQPVVLQQQVQVPVQNIQQMQANVPGQQMQPVQPVYQMQPVQPGQGYRNQMQPTMYNQPVAGQNYQQPVYSAGEPVPGQNQQNQIPLYNP